jgi:hypothetical protein
MLRLRRSRKKTAGVPSKWCGATWRGARRVLFAGATTTATDGQFLTGKVETSGDAKILKWEMTQTTNLRTRRISSVFDGSKSRRDLYSFEAGFFLFVSL